MKRPHQNPKATASVWPFNDKEIMTKVWVSLVLHKYDLSDRQLEEIKETLQLFCTEGIKAYRSSRTR